MMTTLEEEEERTISDESDGGGRRSSKIILPLLPKKNFSDVKAQDIRRSSFAKSLDDLGSCRNLFKKAGSSIVKKNADGICNAESSNKEPSRMSSTIDNVIKVLRRPSSATIEKIGTLRRGSKGVSRSNLSISPLSSNFEPIPQTSGYSLSLQKLPSKSCMSSQNQLVRRPSGAITFHPDQMNMHQRRYIMGLLRGSNSSLPELSTELSIEPPKKKIRQKPCRDGNDSYISAMSALYAKLLCVLGIAFPVTEVLASHVPTHYYQAYHLYLYIGSLSFMFLMYFTLLKDRAIFKIIQNSLDVEKDEVYKMRTKGKQKGKRMLKSPVRYGSFYLRLGAVAFGIGSMVYSGLEFGQYFELKRERNCHNVIQAVTPVTRMILTLIQMQFIFLSSRQIEMSKYRVLARFGLMHMIATNLCEWFNVLVEETKHEIVHLTEYKHFKEQKKADEEPVEMEVHDIFECRRANVMGSLVQDASPFLFPCTIEYSLICAVILYEMWKDVKKVPGASAETEETTKTLPKQISSDSESQKSTHFLSVDCSNAHKGLFCGILVLVMTIISLIMFFVMTKDPAYHQLAVYEVNVCELTVYCITTLAVIAGGWQMRYFKYRLSTRIHHGLGLDNTLLMWAQTGTYIYCMFSIIACYFMIDHDAPGGLITELISLIQTTCQTAFILDATFRRTDSIEQHKRKPGRQIVTFLIVANMTLWLLNTLQKNRAEFRPTHLEFYGVWAWTIITHISMPLAIFYRFHSTICLFEVWKNVYKFKPELQV